MEAVLARLPGSSEEELADDYTQEIMGLALKSIDKFEGQISKSKKRLE